MERDTSSGGASTIGRAASRTDRRIDTRARCHRQTKRARRSKLQDSAGAQRKPSRTGEQTETSERRREANFWLGAESWPYKRARARSHLRGPSASGSGSEPASQRKCSEKWIRRVEICGRQPSASVSGSRLARSRVADLSLDARCSALGADQSRPPSAGAAEVRGARPLGASRRKPFTPLSSQLGRD